MELRWNSLKIELPLPFGLFLIKHRGMKTKPKKPNDAPNLIHGIFANVAFLSKRMDIPASSVDGMLTRRSLQGRVPPNNSLEPTKFARDLGLCRTVRGGGIYWRLDVIDLLRNSRK